MNTIRAQWEAFSELCLPPDALPIQQQEMRRAFYAGAQGALNLHTAVLPTLSDDAGVAMIESWMQELALFAAEIEAGRA